MLTQAMTAMSGMSGTVDSAASAGLVSSWLESYNNWTGNWMVATEWSHRIIETAEDSHIPVGVLPGRFRVQTANEGIAVANNAVCYGNIMYWIVSGSETDPPIKWSFSDDPGILFVGASSRWRLYTDWTVLSARPGSAGIYYVSMLTLGSGGTWELEVGTGPTLPLSIGEIHRDFKMRDNSIIGYADSSELDPLYPSFFYLMNTTGSPLINGPREYALTNNPDIIYQNGYRLFWLEHSLWQPVYA